MRPGEVGQGSIERDPPRDECQCRKKQLGYPAFNPSRPFGFDFRTHVSDSNEIAMKRKGEASRTALVKPLL